LALTLAPSLVTHFLIILNFDEKNKTFERPKFDMGKKTGSFGVYLGPCTCTKSKSSRFLHVLSGSGQERQPTDKEGPPGSLTARSLHSMHPRPTRVAHRVSKSKTNASTSRAAPQQIVPACLLGLVLLPHLAPPRPPRSRAALEATNPAAFPAPRPRRRSPM